MRRFSYKMNSSNFLRRSLHLYVGMYVCVDAMQEMISVKKSSEQRAQTHLLIDTFNTARHKFWLMKWISSKFASMCVNL